jgi:tetratricopeptide (TPR) repeat protein
VRAGDYLAQALALARATGDVRLRIQTLNRLGNWHLMTAHPEHTIPFHEEALALVQATGDRRELAITSDLLGIAHLMHGDAPAAARYYEQALAHWQAASERQWQVSTLAAFATRGGNALFATAVCVPTPLVQCLAEAAEALAQAQAIAWLNGEATVLIWMGALLIPRGETARALEVLRGAREIALELDHQVWLLTVDCLEGAAALDLLDLATAEQAYRRSLERGRAVGSDFVELTMSAYLALTLLAQGRTADAAVALDAVSGPALPLQSQAHHQVWYARARLALARSDGSEALAIAEGLLERLTARWGGAPDGTALRLAPRLWLLQGEALALCTEETSDDDTDEQRAGPGDLRALQRERPGGRACLRGRRLAWRRLPRGSGVQREGRLPPVHAGLQRRLPRLHGDAYPPGVGRRRAGE